MVEFTNLTKRKFRTRSLRAICQKIFSKQFELSVVFAPPFLMRRLNVAYRRKNKIADVLSFLIEKNKSGEVFINAREKNIPFLLTHGCLHLLGYDHKKLKDAKVMENKEKRILQSSRS